MIYDSGFSTYDGRRVLNLEQLAELLAQNRVAAAAPVKEFTIGGRPLAFNSHPAIMGVVNLSTDSWYRESVCLTTERAIQRGQVLVAQGAAMVDVGAESTLAHAARADEAEQNAKLLPVVRALRQAGIPVSVETYQPTVTPACLGVAEAGVRRMLKHVGVLPDIKVGASPGTRLMQVGGPDYYVYTPEFGGVFEPLVELGAQLGVDVAVRPWGIMDRSLIIPDAVISTVPGGENDLVFAEPIRAGAVLFDVAYDPWPSRLATDWDAAGGTIISGLDLLINQAVGQGRLFLPGAREEPLPREPVVIAAMRAAVA